MNPGKLILVWPLAALCATHAPAAMPSAEQTEYFEAKVRPILADVCYKCHSAESGKSKGGLLLDSRDAMLKGGDSGPALVPGHPEKSLLIKAVHYSDEDLRMPPQKEGGKLAPEKIAALEAWIRMGAPDPRATGGAPQSGIAAAFEKAKTHWAFQPIAMPAPPKAKDREWVRTPVDEFVRAKMESQRVKPAAPADPRSLLRRVYFDLIGLPPTAEEMSEFLADRSDHAFEKVVEELLASPRYGERWGRYWLDVARYADTKGYVFQEERRFPFSYTYRDYVIRAFNEDKPYDRFLLEQIAADQLDLGDDKAPLAAMGFLTLGRRFLNNQNDIIDDRMDVTIRGTMALTIACTRCHDHKFDPITTKDYYALHGVFASSKEPEEQPLLGKEPKDAAYAEYLKRKGEIQAKVDAKTDENVRAFRRKAEEATADYLAAARDAKKRGKNESLSDFAKARKLEPKVLERWISTLERKPELAAAAGPSNGLPEAVRAFLATSNAPPNLPAQVIEEVIRRKISNETEGMRKELAALDWNHPGAPQRAMALVDKEKPANSHVFIRGNAATPGPAVPRRFLEVLAGSNPPPFKAGSGRLDLARAIASRDNPLTARVWVNRVWNWHFGAPLAGTPSDFGVRTEAPVHLDLLNWLAADFMEQGWSVKQLHKRIVLSNTYRQSADAEAASDKRDPANQLVHRFNRRRLDFEALRDTLLATSGRLDTSAGGQPVDLIKEPFSRRRTVYGFIDRQNLPGLFRTFDFANPDSTSPQRNVTTVPQQALFLMNSPFVIEQARALVGRPEIASLSNGTAKADALFQVVFQRPPDRNEARLAMSFLEKNPAPPPRPAIAPGWHYGHGWFNPLANLIKDYRAMTNFAGVYVSPARKFPLPDDRSHVQVTADGGHPGRTPKFASIRRWVSPADGTITIEATLQHENKAGDGVRGMIVTGRGGIVGEWTAFTNRVATDTGKLDVKLGETVDFVVDCKGNENSDSYIWAPRITLVPAGDDKTVRRAWDAKKDFTAPEFVPDPLTPWEKLAQVLLLSNELMFVD